MEELASRKSPAKPMRMLALVLLMLQLQPVLDVMLCSYEVYNRAGSTSQLRAQVSLPQVAPIGSAVPAGCFKLGFCTPTSPAILTLVQSIQIFCPPHREPLLTKPPMAPQELPSAHFHPPKT